uniref:Uncharacterized protein n=1 Tax=Rhizophora mucronata TaxID=61149 RepID=A0A2P2N437_RHIMU
MHEYLIPPGLSFISCLYEQTPLYGRSFHTTFPCQKVVKVMQNKINGKSFCWL